MAKTVALVTIHGMGDTDKDYYADFYDEIRDRVDPAVWDKTIFRSIYYQDELQHQQQDIFNRMRTEIDWKKLRKFLLFGFSDAASIEHRKSDDDSAYFRVQMKILEALDAVWLDAGEQPVPVILLAQSLGCQVVSNYIWDAKPGFLPPAGVWAYDLGDGVDEGSPRDLFRRLRSLERLYTTGCNIPIFVAGHKRIVAISRPNNNFEWHNFYDEDDVLGWPLQPLSPSYRRLVNDIPVNAGGGVFGTVFKSWNPFSHGQYWTDGEVLRPLAAALEALA